MIKLNQTVEHNSLLSGAYSSVGCFLFISLPRSSHTVCVFSIHILSLSPCMTMPCKVNHHGCLSVWCSHPQHHGCYHSNRCMEEDLSRKSEGTARDTAPRSTALLPGCLAGWFTGCLAGRENPGSLFVQPVQAWSLIHS